MLWGLFLVLLAGWLAAIADGVMAHDAVHLLLVGAVVALACQIRRVSRMVI